MNVKVISQRYAQALLQVSLEKKNVDGVYQDLQSLQELLKSSQELREFWFYPKVPRKIREAVFQKLFAARFEPLTLTFFGFLIQKDRLQVIEQIIADFEVMVREERGILAVQAKSSVRFTEDQEKALKLRLREKFKKEIQLEVAVDPDLIGGFKLQIKDQIFDTSLAFQLQNFKNQLLTVI